MTMSNLTMPHDDLDSMWICRYKKKHHCCDCSKVEFYQTQISIPLDDNHFFSLRVESVRLHNKATMSEW